MRHVINYRIHVWKIKGIGELLLVSLDTFIVIIFSVTQAVLICLCVYDMLCRLCTVTLGCSPLGQCKHRISHLSAYKSVMLLLQPHVVHFLRLSLLKASAITMSP